VREFIENIEKYNPKEFKIEKKDVLLSRRKTIGIVEKNIKFKNNSISYH
jgi:hypothetical protein